MFALGAFFAQRRVLGKKVYTSLAGKGDSGLPTQLPDGVRRLCYGIAIPWATLTVVIYAMAVVGGFVETWGRDYTPTLRHYVKAFGIEFTPNGIIWAGAAWNSFWTTIKLAAIASPLTAALGILSAYLLTRQTLRRPGRLRVRDHALVRDPRHGDRRVLHPRLQRPADRDHRHGDRADRLLRLPQHAGRACARAWRR